MDQKHYLISGEYAGQVTLLMKFFTSYTPWKCDTQNSEPKVIDRSSQMQQNQLLLGIFLNFLILLYKSKNANSNNVAVFMCLLGATI